MDWQELAVAVIVGCAVVSLYRHLHGIFAMPKRGGRAACHGCDDCAPEERVEPAAAEGSAAPDLAATIR